MEKFKNNKVIIITICLVVVLAIAVIFAGKSTNDVDQGKAIAKVNGTTIFENELKTFLKEKFNVPSNFNYSSLTKEQQEKIVAQVVAEKILIKQAKSSGVAKQEETRKQITLLKNNIIREAFLKKIANEAASEDNIKKRYEEKSEKLQKELENKKEIRVKHILVKTRSEINKVTRELYKKSFEEVAKEKSIDTVSAKQGGDLGYFIQGTMIKKFENVAFSLKKDQISNPFKTEFGWHIVKAIDTRDAQVPTLEKLSDVIKRELSVEAIENYVQKIHNDLKVELL